VSTGDQTTDNQLLALRQWAAGQGHVVAAEYTDDGVSGAKTSRSALNRLLADAARNRFDVVAVTSLDRLGRSLAHLIRLSASFEQLGIDLAVRNLGLDTTTPAGKLAFHMLGALAEFERALIRERTMAGLARAKAQGRRGGRPRVSSYIERRVADLLRAGTSLRETARMAGVSKATVQRVQRDEFQQ
jgi:DNA invertase Pin-like site-specific DNA recombinase